jgi:hypothetical protein
MCFICDGGTVEELFADTRERIDKYGFTMVGVGEGVRSWVYTIGLLETFGHPELVVTTLSMEGAASLFTGLVDRIRNGESFDASSRESVHVDVPIRFSSVHPTQWLHGRFAMWVNYYGHLGVLPAQPEAVQVLWPNELDIFPPDRDFCHEHRNCQPLLSSPVAADVHETQRRRRRRKKRDRR